VEAHESSRAPLPMLAFAEVVMEKTVKSGLINNHDFFDGVAIEVPARKDALMLPQCHSIVGQKLLCVDWHKMCGIGDINCLRCKRGIPINDRTDFSKNRLSFPIFGLDGAPLWCMAQSMVCNCCEARLNSNTGEVSCQLPACARTACPVECKCALDDKNSHLGKSATNVFDLLMPTCGNGDSCSRLLLHSMNQSHAERVEENCSFCKRTNRKEPPETHIENCGSPIAAFPPLGDSTRDTCDAACSNSNTPWGISDHDRHVRETKGVSCQSSFAQDHTHEVCEN